MINIRELRPSIFVIKETFSPPSPNPDPMDAIYIEEDATIQEYYGVGAGDILYIAKPLKGIHDNIKYLPITLTPEILVKVGFKKSAGDWYKFDHSGVVLEFNVGLKKLCIKVMNDAITAPREIEYLHQVQNIYFDLTGQSFPVDINTLSGTYSSF